MNLDRRFLLNVGLAVVGVAGVGIFSMWSQLPGIDSVPPEVMARIVEGEAKVRAFSQTEVRVGTKGTELLNQDSIWVGPTGRVVLEFYGSKRVELGPNSLVYLKKPFRSPYILENTALPFRVLTGEVKAENFKAPPEAMKGAARREPVATAEAGAPLSPVLSAGTTPSPVPVGVPTPDASPQPSASASPVPPGVHPVPGSHVTFSVTAPTQKLLLGWPETGTGVVELSDEHRKRWKRIPIARARTLTIEIADPGSERVRYQWSVLGSDGQKISGPHSFTVGKFSTEAVEELLEQGDSKKKLYIE